MQKGFTVKPRQRRAKQEAGFIPILIAILIAALVGGYLVYSNYSQSRTKIPTVSPQTTPPSPTPSAPSSVPSGTGKTVYTESDRSANWKTYTNTKYRFTFKYPTNASIAGDAENIIANKVLGQAVSISGPNLDLNMAYSINIASESIIKGSEIATLNGQQWNVLTEDSKGSCPPGLGPCTSMLTYQAVINNKLISFTFRGTTNKTIPNQILSTFRFTQ